MQMLTAKGWWFQQREAGSSVTQKQQQRNTAVTETTDGWDTEHTEMGCFGDKDRGCSTYTSCRAQHVTQEMHQREAGRGFVRLNEAFALQVGANCPVINRTCKSWARHTDQRPLTLLFAFNSSWILKIPLKIIFFLVITEQKQINETETEDYNHVYFQTIIVREAYCNTRKLKGLMECNNFPS